MAGFTLRPTVRADLDALDKNAPARMKSLTGVDAEGNVIGIGGITYLHNGDVMVFSELTDSARASPVSLHKAALRVLREAKDAGIKELLAFPDYEVSTAAGRWLARLGFVPQKRGDKLIWVWKTDGL